MPRRFFYGILSTVAAIAGLLAYVAAMAEPKPATPEPTAASTQPAAKAPASQPKQDDASTQRPANWAKRLERPGLSNFHQLDDGLYRGAQPKAEGIAELERLGVKTIVCLRSFHSDDEITEPSKIALETIPMYSWDIEEEDAVRFLKIVTDKNRRPVFVHCQHGADRTGVMCAVYRIVVQGWTKKEALRELTDGGFNFHAVHVNIPKFIEKLDVAKIREKVGLKEPAASPPAGGAE